MTITTSDNGVVGIEPLNDGERYLTAHIADLQRKSAACGVPSFSAFLTEREAALAECAVKGKPLFYGGYDGAARTVCGFFEGTYAQTLPKEELFPVCAVTLSFREFDRLSHRDFLGAILVLGIKRELVGDILVAQGYAVVFCLKSAQELVLRLDKVGRTGVSAEKGLTKPLPPIRTEKIETTVSSLRLDCILSAAAGISRDKSALLIKSGRVNADFSPCLRADAQIKENTVISVRGVGRYRLSAVNGESRKGRLRIVIEKFV